MTVSNMVSGEGQNYSATGILGVDVGLGKDKTAIADLTVGQDIMGVSTLNKLGADKPSEVNHIKRNDLVSSPASGYNADGTADYGDGQIQRTTDYGEDDQDSLTFHKPREPNITDYESGTI